MEKEKKFDLNVDHKVGKGFHLDFLKKIFEIEKPLAKMLRSKSGHYLYDTGTNKILECRKEVFELIEYFLTTGVDKAKTEFISRYNEQTFYNASEEIVNAILEENILRVKKTLSFGLSDHFQDIEEILSASLQSINLEVTTACNLRCGYCPYSNYIKGFRNHGNSIMSFDVARKAIDFLKAHSANNKKVAIAFYGGEPLLQFPFIKKYVQYARKALDEQDILFTTTTNATLIDDEVAEFLLEEGFSVLASLDGPSAFHDRYRKDVDGKGSFEKTLKGLKILAKKYHEIKTGAISINMVYAPPYSKEKLNAIEHFLKELQWLPEINVSTVYPSAGTIGADMVTEQDLEQDKDMMQWALEKYRVDLDTSTAMVKGIIGKLFARLMKRPVYSQPLHDYSLNGCCLPGQRKSFITANGQIHICEKISDNAPAIGHVDTGFDFEAIKKFYINEYAEKSFKDCSGCWGARLCDICYYLAFNANGEMDMGKKKKHCGFHLSFLEKIMQDFITLLEEKPGRLDYLYGYDMV